MDTSNSLPPMFEGKLGETSIAELEATRLSEDSDLARSAREVVNGLADRLRPLLKYVAKPIFILPMDRHTPGDHQSATSNDRVVDLGEVRMRGPRHALLSEGGEFFMATPCSLCAEAGRAHYYDKCMSGDHTYIPLRTIVERLREIFKKAEERRQLHLASIAEARKTLDAMAALLAPKSS